MTHDTTNAHGDDIFVFMERLTPKQDRASDCLRICLDTSKLLHGRPGLIQSMVMRPEKEGGPICSMSVWRSKRDFQQLLASDEFAALMKSDEYANIKAWMKDYDGQMMALADGWHP